MKGSVEHCKAFLIDWDGTLVNSLAIKIANAAEVLAERFGAEREGVSEAYRRHSGVPRRELFDRIARDTIGRPLSDDEFDSVSPRFSELNRERIAASARMRPGALEAVSELARDGRLVFISTATAQDEIDPLARSFGIADYCTEILGSRPGFTKGPVHAAHVAGAYGLSREEMAGVGDDIEDMKLFRDAGITAIGITGTRSRNELEQAGADLVIDNLTEVAASVVG